jgi:LuxR family maltose regulon positive regulatory protein
LDTLLAVFPQESKTHHHQPKLIGTSSQTQWLSEPLSQREREVLQVLARGASNQEIAQELVIALDTVKRHVAHIFSKLGVQNRVQAVKQAQRLMLLDENFGAPS